MADLPLLDRCMTPSERKALLKRAPVMRGHAWKPGTGPAGETCGSCANLAHRRMSKIYLKCALMSATWTGGGATDVKARDAACDKWARKEFPPASIGVEESQK